MNLKKLKDSLFINQSGKWEYTALPRFKSNEVVKGIDVLNGKSFSVKNGVYALFNIKDTTKFSYNNQTDQLELQKVTKQEVQDWLKENYSPNNLKNDTAFENDLEYYFKRWLNIVVEPDLFKLYRLDYDSDIKSRIDILVNLHTIESSSELTSLLISKLENKNFSVGAFNLKFKKNVTFKKGNNIDFDVDAFVASMKKSKKEFDESKALAAGERYRNRVRNLVKKGITSLHKIFGEHETYLRQFITGLVEIKNASFDNVIEIVVDDFLTTGTTLKSMLNEIRLVVDEKEPVLIYALTIFKFETNESKEK